MLNQLVVSSRLALAAVSNAIKCPLTGLMYSTSRPPARRQAAAHQLRLISNLRSSTLSMSRFLLLFNCSTLSATCFLLLLSVLIPVRLVTADGDASASLATSDNRHSGQEPPSDSLAGGLSALLAGSLDEKLMGGAGEPRQYFKLRVIPSPSNSARKKKAHSRAIANKSEHKQKITNAALKKLLNQSLLKAANSSSSSILNSNSSGIGGSNFRLVFVQRAPVVSDTSSSTTKPSTESSPDRAVVDSSNFLTGRKVSPPSTSGGSTSSSGGDAGSGSSLSKQLAETLISSTLNMAFNSPSISSLASKLAVKGFETMMANRNSTTESAESKVRNSVKREHAPLSTSINSKTRQPSKVYNLPIKFVADGQPYHLTVFSALKKHLLASAGSTNSGATKKSLHKTHHHANGSAAAASLKVSKYADQHGKHRKLEQSQKKKETHGNSRLIYLPLKYFNNGRISKVIINSSSSSPSSSSSSSSVSLKRKGR